MAEDMEILKLKRNIRNKIAAILDIADSWKDLAEVIPKKTNAENFEPMYTAEQIWKFQAKSQRSEGPTLALLEDWSRRGQPRPTVGQLLKLLMDVEQIRAADLIRTQVLHCPPLKSTSVASAAVLVEHLTDQITSGTALSFSEQPTVAIRSSGCEENPAICQLDNNQLTNQLQSETSTEVRPIDPISNALSHPLASSNTLISQFNYNILKEITDNFNSKPYAQGGRQLGEGAFGAVFLAHLPNIGKVAVKRLKGDPEIIKQFRTEVNVLSQFRHENLLSLIGNSFDDEACCLVYDFMSGGSLQDRLACKNGVAALNWPQRITIAVGTAKGILHLHTFLEKPLVHRDIKSANVLLDANLNPKVGDFGLARQGSRGSGAASTAVRTNTVFGTSVYMPREAFHGDISVKMDVFSFGIVLFELLTGLPPYNSEQEEDLLSYVNENCEDLADFLDPKADLINTDEASKLHSIAEVCTNDFKNKRPTLQQVMPDLENLLPSR